MSAASKQLRQAANLLRDRAEAARKGRWFADGTEVAAAWMYDDRSVASTAGGSPVPDGQKANAAYIATVDPVVGLALADSLAATADMAESNDGTWRFDLALKVADAILAGGAS